jgi:hypothetical protein
VRRYLQEGCAAHLRSDSILDCLDGGPFFAHWLARWAFYAISDSIIREKAFALAIREQCSI